MNESEMKNIVILKDLPSNIVQEAIVILKKNIKAKDIEKKKENVKVTIGGKTCEKDYIVKEAQSVVANYISKLEKPKQIEVQKSKIKRKYENLKKLTIFFAITAILGIIVNFI